MQQVYQRHLPYRHMWTDHQIKRLSLAWTLTLPHPHPDPAVTCTAMAIVSSYKASIRICFPLLFGWRGNGVNVLKLRSKTVVTIKSKSLEYTELQ